MAQEPTYTIQKASSEPIDPPNRSQGKFEPYLVLESQVISELSEKVEDPILQEISEISIFHEISEISICQEISEVSKDKNVIDAKLDQPVSYNLKSNGSIASFLKFDIEKSIDGNYL